MDQENIEHIFKSESVGKINQEYLEGNLEDFWYFFIESLKKLISEATGTFFQAFSSGKKWHVKEVVSMDYAIMKNITWLDLVNNIKEIPS